MPRLPRTRPRLAAAIEACEPRRLMSTVAPAYASQIGLTGLVASSTSFEDNFDGTAIDKTKWQVRDGYRWRAYPNAPVSTFTYTDESPIQVGGGELQLIAHNDPTTGQYKGAFLQSGRQFNDNSKDSPVPPAKLTPGYGGDFEQTYGYWETRAKFNSLPGMWSAFWSHSYRMVEVRDDASKASHPEVYGNEYDIVEHSARKNKYSDVTGEVSVIAIANGYGDYRAATGAYPSTASLGPANTPPSAYHVYGMLWTDKAVKFYVDGNLVHTVTEARFVSQVPQMAMLSIEVGAPGSNEDDSGSLFFGDLPAGGYGSKATSQARATFDYVRVWQLAGQSTPPANTPSSASGVVYLDSDDNGVRDSGEAGRGGVTIFVDYDFDGVRDSNEPQTTTNADGTYRLDGMAPHADVDLRIVPAGGVTWADPESGKLEWITTPGQLQTRRDFAMKFGPTPDPEPEPTPTPGSIAGYVFDDADGDAVRDAAESGRSGAIVYVDADNDGTRDAGELYATTATDGTFKISNVTAGKNAVVRLVGVSGFAQTLPTGNGTYNLTLASGQAYAQAFFGIKSTATPPPPPTPPSGDGQLTGTVIGTAGSWANSGTTIAKAFDNNLATYVDLAVASGGWAGLDLGSSKQITKIQYAPRAGFTTRMVGGRFEGSNSATFASGVVTLATVTANPPGNVLTTVAVSNAGTFRYVRYIGPNNAYGDVGEVKFFGTGGNTTAPTPGKLAGAVIGTAGSWANSGSTIARAFDGNLSTYVDLATPSGGWAGLDLGTGRSIVGVQFAPRQGFASRMVGGVFQASNSATFASGVVTLATITAVPAQGAVTSLSFSATSAYRYVRYLSPNGSYGDVGELAFYGA